MTARHGDHREPFATDPPELSWRKHVSSVAALGLPLIGSHLAQIIIGVTDTVMLGWYGVSALAAGALGAAIFGLLMLVGSGFAWAVMPLAASAAARGEETQLRVVTRMGLWLSVLFALAVMPLMFWSETLLFRGQDATVAANAQDYLRIAGWGMFPALLAMVLKSYLSALESTRVILRITLLAACLNAAANWALIFGNWGFPELGLQGAAAASLFSHLLACVGFALYTHFAPALRGHALFQGLADLHWPAFQQVLRLGWPIGLTTLAEAGLFAASTIMMGYLGESVLAAHGIALQLASITFVVHLGLSQVGTVRAGQAASHGNWASLERGAIVVGAASALLSACAIAVFLLFPEPLVGLFLSSDDPRAPEILPIGVSLLVIAAIFQLTDGAQVIALGLLRGIQDTRVPMFLAAASYWVVGAPAGYVLGLEMRLGGPGIWFGLVIGLGLAALGLTLRFLGQLRQHRGRPSPSG